MARSQEPPLLFGNATDIGRQRDRNEDFLGYFRSDNRHLFVVADGMGGEAGGREASTTAIRQVQHIFETNPQGTPQVLLTDCVCAANAACVEYQQREPSLRGMGTTMDLLFIENRNAWWAHVGDSRIYRIRDGRAEQITEDHTRINQMVRTGMLTAEDAAEHPDRNILSRVVGRDSDIVPDLSPGPVELLDGDAFVLCSDGLHDSVKPNEIAWIVDRYGPQRACKRLVDLANERGGHDNITVQVVYKGMPKSAWQRMKTLTTIPPALSIKRKRGMRRAVIAAMALAAALLCWFAMHKWVSTSYQQSQPNLNTNVRKQLEAERGKGHRKAATPSGKQNNNPTEK